MLEYFVNKYVTEVVATVAKSILMTPEAARDLGFVIFPKSSQHSGNISLELQFKHEI